MISGYWEPDLPYPFLSVGVIPREVNYGSGLIPFLVDTGAALTVVHATDAIRYLGVPYASLDSSSWTESVAITGIGGYALYQPVRASLLLFHDTPLGHIERLERTIFLGDLSTEDVPSLLGRDLMKDMRLVVDRDVSITLELA